MSRPVRHHRRGNYGALFGISAVVLLGFTAIGIDSGWQRVAMTQLHNAADAGAHAGAMELDGTVTGMQNALIRAVAVTSANEVHGRAVPIDGGTSVANDGTDNNPDVTFGRFDSPGENTCLNDKGCWTVLGGTPNSADYTDQPGDVDVAAVNAIRVDAVDQVNTFFGGFPFGTTTLGAANYSVARLPIYDGLGCAFPLSMPMCSIAERESGTVSTPTTATPCGKTVRMSFTSANNDNVAWSVPAGTPGADRDATLLEMVLGEEGTCVSAIGNDDVGDGTEDLDLINGGVTSVLQALNTQLTSTTSSWNSDWGACPTSTSCDTSASGTCKVTGPGTTIAPSTSADCSAAGGAWEPSCPTLLPDCTGSSGSYMRRTITLFDPAALPGGMGCSAQNGNPDTALSSYNFNNSVDAAGFATIVIYNIKDTGNPKYIDAYISCTNEDGSPYDSDANSVPEATRTQYDDTVIDPPEDGTVAIVE